MPGPPGPRSKLSGFGGAAAKGESEPLIIHNCPLISKMRASLVAQLVKNLPAMQETWVRSLGWKALLEKGTATHSSILAWRIPWTV